MDTHWRFTKFLKRSKKGLWHAGSVALRAFAVAAMLLLLLGPLPPHPASNTPQAEADNLLWSAVNLFLAGAGAVVDVTVAANGDVFVVADDGGANNFDVYRSTDKGATWTLVGDNQGLAAPVRIRTSTKYGSDNGVFVLGADGIVHLSRNRGATFGGGTQPNTAAFLPGAQSLPTSLAVAPDCDLSKECVVLVGVADTDADGAVEGGIATFAFTGGSTNTWAAAVAHTFGTALAAGEDVLDVAFAPDFGINSGKVALLARVGAASIIAGLLDVNSSGVVDGADDLAAGFAAAITSPAIIDGLVDVDHSTVVGAEDDYGSTAVGVAGGTLCGFNIINGGFDVNNNGAIDPGDNSPVTGGVDDPCGISGIADRLILAGALDVTGNGVIFTDDDAVAGTIPAAFITTPAIVNGGVDVNHDGVIDAQDDFGSTGVGVAGGTLFGFNVINGAFDVDNSGAISGADAALVAGAGLAGTTRAFRTGTTVFPADDLAQILTGAGGAQACTAGSLFIPSDYTSSGATDSRRYYIGLDCPTATNDGLYRRSATAFGQPAVAIMDDGFASIVGSGTYDLASPIVGGYFGAGTIRVTTTQGQTEEDTDATDGGGGPVRLAIAPDGTIYATSSGALGGVFRSTTGGDTIYGLGLTNANYTAVGPPASITHMSIGGTTPTIYLTSDDGAGNEILWRGTNVSTSNTEWLRINHSTAGAHRTDVTEAMEAGGTAWLIRNGAADQVQRATNRTDFTATAKDPGVENPTALLATSSTAALVGMADGFVWRTSDSGATWTKSTTDLGGTVHEIRASGTAYLASSDGPTGNLEAWRSTDGGATWTQVGAASETDAWGGGGLYLAVSGDPTNANIIYAAPNGAGDGLYRYDLSATPPMWQEIGWPGGGRPNGLFVSANGTLFAGDGLDSAGGGAPDEDFESTFYAKTITDNTISLGTQTWRATVNGAAGNDVGGPQLFAAVEGASVTVYFVDTTGASAIRTWADTTAYLTAPLLVSPGDNASVPSNLSANAGVPVTFTWGSVPGASAYDIQVALDTAFTQVVVAGLGVAAPTFTTGVNVFADGLSFYWRARATAVTIAGLPVAHTGPWSAGYKFTTGILGQPTQPVPSLPLEGQTLSGLGTNVSWNNPAGTAQVHIEIMPLNLDGPGINLVRSDPAILAGMYTIVAPDMAGGTNFVMLPGSTYTWRVRATRSMAPNISLTDPSWGPWSEVRTFMTRTPSSASVSLASPAAGATVTGKATLTWADGNNDVFYYEVQLSKDPRFGEGGPVNPVLHLLIHGGVTTPKRSLAPGNANYDSWWASFGGAGTYYWRVRPRLQATPLGAAEPGVAWTAAGSFMSQ